jgi:hypothetical protein
MQKKIILEIKIDGTVGYELQGVKGKVCTKETDWLDKLLGKVKSRTFKKEFYEHDMIMESIK